MANMELYHNITWEIGIPADTVLYTDGSLLRQVIVDIIKNAAEAGAKNILHGWHHVANVLLLFKKTWQR